MLTADRLRELLRYDSGTGQFTWVSSPRARIKVGDRAGTPNDRGHLYIKVCRKIYPAHRLAWLWMTGDWPILEIDHIDMNKSNNVWSNLRQCTRSQNIANTKPRTNNKSGFKGVSYARRQNKWVAQIGIKGRKINLGYFNTPKEAHGKYCAAARELYGEFARVA